jgi:hypothetical protein
MHQLGMADLLKYVYPVTIRDQTIEVIIIPIKITVIILTLPTWLDYRIIR